MTEFDLATYLTDKRVKIDASLRTLLASKTDHGGLLDAMSYSLMAGGKRLRPVLCMAASEAVGGNDTDALTVGCALEMIHTYSLIHDDLPAMDDDNLRRGQPTCHVAFDEATAILAGDALLTMAFEVLSAPAVGPDFERNADHWARTGRIIYEISRAAGCQGMIAGQMTDIRSEGKRLELSELESLHLAKTGALIEAAVVAGAIAGGGDDDQIRQLRRYARDLGLAFQVADDILNVEGDPDLMGKAVGTDQNRQKSTYPSLLGLEASKDLAKKTVADALHAIRFFDNRSEPLRAVAEYVIRRKR